MKKIFDDISIMKAVFNSFKEGDPYLIDLPIPNIGDNDILTRTRLNFFWYRKILN